MNYNISFPVPSTVTQSIMSSLPLAKKIKPISQSEKDLVIGYTKESSKLSLSYPFPIALSYLCLIYYFEYDYFHECDRGLRINDKKDTVKVIGRKDQWISKRAFGKIVIQTKIPMIYSWKFKLIDDNYSVPAIFISTRNGASSADIKNQYDTYELWRSGHITSWLTRHESQIYERYCNPWQQADVITMEVNTKEKHIKYFINDKDYGVAFKDIDFNDNEFKMGVHVEMRGTDYKIKLIEFSKKILH